MPNIEISISDCSLEYLNNLKTDKSIFIESLIEARRIKDCQQELENNYLELENYPDFHAEVDALDCTAGDGLDFD